MGYARNFGMRSFENIVRDGRFRIPRDLTTGGFGGNPVLIGTAVTVDPATPGFLRRPDAGAAPNQLSGLVIYEHIQMQGVDTTLVTTYDEPFNQVPAGQYAQMMHGVGGKVWFKNTTDKVMYDGRTQTGSALVVDSFDPDAGGAEPVRDVAVGDYLVPAADGRWTGSTDAAVGWLQVEQVNPNTGLYECRLTF